MKVSECLCLSVRVEFKEIFLFTTAGLRKLWGDNDFAGPVFCSMTQTCLNGPLWNLMMLTAHVPYRLVSGLIACNFFYNREKLVKQLL